MVTEHIAREMGVDVGQGESRSASVARQGTLDGGSEPVAVESPAKKPRKPKRTEEQRIADALAEAEEIKVKMKTKVSDAVAQVRDDVAELVGKAKTANMPKLAAELQKVSDALQRTAGLSD